MANIHLITGYAGSGHISSADQGAFNAALFGTGSYVLNIGNKFAASVITNNKIRLLAGDLIMQGRHVRFNPGEVSLDLTIENGETGQNRNDLIVCRYTKDATDSKEKCELIVIKGTATSGTAIDPAHNTGSILDGAAIADFPLYRVPIAGLNVGTLVPLFKVVSVPTGVGDSSGFLTVGGLKLTAGVDYGTALPAAGNAGRLFFRKV